LARVFKSRTDEAIYDGQTAPPGVIQVVSTPTCTTGGPF
jgi:hypothetical protein